jgi:hypothetical protein
MISRGCWEGATKMMAGQRLQQCVLQAVAHRNVKQQEQSS